MGAERLRLAGGGACRAGRPWAEAAFRAKGGRAGPGACFRGVDAVPKDGALTGVTEPAAEARGGGARPDAWSRGFDAEPNDGAIGGSSEAAAESRKVVLSLMLGLLNPGGWDQEERGCRG